MTQLDIHEAGVRLADLIARARAGEEVMIADAGRPVARLVPVKTEDEKDENSRLKMLGMFEGQIWMSDDCFDPLTDEELEEWGL
jgi:prevent-host-death family protein